MTWDPAQYERFRLERSLPHAELLELIQPQPDMTAVDLGCGTGELTLELHRRFACASTLGLDSSAAMLEKSRSFAEKGLSFQLGDLTGLQGSYDLIHSNAALQWVDDHPKLFADLARHLKAGGQLAVQMPANFDHPSHTVARSLSQQSPFKEALGETLERSVLAPEEYSRLLYRLGFDRQKVVLRVFPHVLENRDEVVEWVKGSLLTWYRERLPDDLYAEFLADYRDWLAAELPDESPFLYPFKRIFLWAHYPNG